MSITIKHKDIEDILTRKLPIFINRGLPVKTIYWLSRIEKELVNHSKEYHEMRLKFISDSCNKDENGNLMTDPQTGSFIFPDNGSLTIVNRKILELLEMQVNIPFDRIKIKIDNLQGSISAKEILIMEQLIDFVEE